MANDVAIGVIVACGSVLGPLLLSALNARQRHHEQEDREKREDEVAARLERAQAEAAAHAREVALALAISSKATADRLDEIHGLVNSQMTAALKAELAAVLSRAAVLQEMRGLKSEAGMEPDSTDELSVALQQAEVLRRTIADREPRPASE